MTRMMTKHIFLSIAEDAGIVQFEVLHLATDRCLFVVHPVTGLAYRGSNFEDVKNTMFGMGGLLVRSMCYLNNKDCQLGFVQSGLSSAEWQGVLCGTPGCVKILLSRFGYWQLET